MPVYFCNKKINNISIKKYSNVPHDGFVKNADQLFHFPVQ